MGECRMLIFRQIIQFSIILNFLSFFREVKIGMLLLAIGTVIHEAARLPG